MTVGLGNEAIAAFEDVLGFVPPRGLDTTPQDTEEWDSLGHIHLMSLIEARTGARFDEQDLVAVPTRSLGSYVGLS